MKHLFSSGEAMYKKNERELSEGILEGEYLEYDKVDSDTKFYCSGLLNDKNVKVSFILSKLRTLFDYIELQYAMTDNELWVMIGKEMKRTVKFIEK